MSLFNYSKERTLSGSSSPHDYSFRGSTIGQGAGIAVVYKAVEQKVIINLRSSFSNTIVSPESEIKSVINFFHVASPNKRIFEPCNPVEHQFAARLMLPPIRHKEAMPLKLKAILGLRGGE